MDFSSDPHSSQGTVMPVDLPPQDLTPRPFKRKRALLGLAMVFLLLVVSGSVLTVTITQKIATDHTLATAASQAQGKLTSIAMSQAQATSSAAAQLTATANAANVTATALANNPHPYGGILMIDDPMSGTHSAFDWKVGSDKYGQCWFANGAYHVSGLCASSNRSIPAKFAFEVQMATTKACGDVQFTSDFLARNRVNFSVRLCQNGSYSMVVSVNDAFSKSKIANGVASNMHTGAEQTNTIGVVADGQKLTLYINAIPVNGVPDTNTSVGTLALWGLDSLTGMKNIEVVYHRARLWML